MRRFSLQLTVVSALAASSAFGGDADDASRFSYIAFSATDLGQPVSIDLRTSNPATPALLMLDTQISLLNPDGPGGIPWLRTFSGTTGFLFVSTDSAGRIFTTGTTPNDVNLLGQTGFIQALSATANGKIDVTNVAAITVGQGPSFSYADRSNLVPSAGLVNGSSGGAAQELDQDGDPDLVIATDSSIAVFRNDGGFNFTDVTATAIPLAAQFETAAVELLHANGDRRIDILIAGGVGDAQSPPLPNILLINQGNMVFTIDPNFPSTDGLPSDIWPADFDLDGDLDIVLSNGVDGVHTENQGDKSVLLVNQGGNQAGVRGQFVVDTAFQSAAWNSGGFDSGLAGGDIDNDGDVDLFVTRSDSQGLDGTPGQPNVLLRNDGNLTFSDITLSNLTPLFSDNSGGARFGDFDSDGNLDLIVANSTVGVPSAQSGIYYRNLGGGAFQEDKANFPQIDESEIALRLEYRIDDVDLDGDLDVLGLNHEFLDFDMSTGASTGGDDLLFVNQGGVQGGTQGTFLLAPGYTSFGVFVSSDMIMADFDIDGDNDIYITSSGGFFQLPGQEADKLLENTRIP